MEVVLVTTTILRRLNSARQNATMGREKLMVSTNTHFLSSSMGQKPRMTKVMNPIILPVFKSHWVHFASIKYRADNERNNI